MINDFTKKEAPVLSTLGLGGGNASRLFLGSSDFSVSRSLRFNSVDKSHLTRTPSSAGNQKTWTWAAWIKKSKFGETVRVFQARDGSSGNQTFIQFRTDDKIYVGGNSDAFIVNTDAVFRDALAWGHLCVRFDTTQATASDRIRIYWNGVQQDLSGTQPTQDYATARINSTLLHSIGNDPGTSGENFNGYLADVHLIDGSSISPVDNFLALDDNGIYQAKRFSGSHGTNGFHLKFEDNTSISTIGTDSSSSSNNFSVYNLLPKTGVYLDDVSGTQRSSEGFGWANMFDGSKDHGAVPNAGSNFTFAPSTSIPFSTLAIYAYKDSSPGTLEINGTNVTSQVPNHSGIGPNQRTVITGISSPLTSIKSISGGSLANIVLAGIEIDGALLLDSASEIDIMFDSPTNGDTSEASGAGGEVNGNYAVLNVIEDSSAGGGAALSNGNLQIDGTSSEQFRAATIPVSSGKWYFEMVQVNGTDFGPGVWAYPLTSPTSNFYQNTNYRYNSNGGVYNQSSKLTDYSTFTRGDIIGTALDMDNGKVYFSKNGTWQNSGDPANQTNPAATGLTGTWVFGASTNGNDTILQANFGATAFAYTAPSGFKALNTANMSEATISNGREYFDTSLWTGNGSTQSISTLEFSPDIVWIKMRSSSAGHRFYDSVRGATKFLVPQGGDAESTQSAGLTSFDSNGFSLGSNFDHNNNSATFAGWAWDSGSSTVTNTDGTISSQVRASQTSGVSIVKYTGNGSSSATVGHGLNAQLKMLIHKRLDDVGSWKIKHTSLSTNHQLLFDSAASIDVTGNHGGGMADLSSSSTFGFAQGLTNVDNVNGNGPNYINICFSEIPGFSAFGSYTGNGSSDGVYVHTGFRPALVLQKRSDSSGHEWTIHDSTREPSNDVGLYLEPSTSNAEQDGNRRDFLSNGFKLRTSSGGVNASGGTYIWAAFAENPFQSNGGLAF
jgi:hypothetical protein